MANFAVWITYPYTVVERVIAQWATYCTRIVCVEHNDDGANNLHCHLHLEECRVSSKRFAQLAGEVAPMTRPNPPKRATSLLSFRTKEYDKHPSGYAYLTKGKYDFSYIQGFTPADWDLWRSSWVKPAEYTKSTFWTKSCEEFEKAYPQEYWAEHADTLEQTVHRTIDRFIFAKYKRQLPPQAESEKAFLMRTFCARFNVNRPVNNPAPNRGNQNPVPIYNTAYPDGIPR